MMGPGLDAAHVRTLLDSPRFLACMPPGWTMPSNHCHCSPSIAIRPAAHPYADRIVFVGDCGVTRLYKDGIGAAYKAAKAAAVTAVFEGISAESFRRHYNPVCRGLIRDNLYGRAMFTVAGIQQKFAHDRRGILRMLAGEHRRGGGGAMSSVMWDMFSGSAPYADIFYRTLWPRFWGRLGLEIALGFGDRAGAEPGGDREAPS